ncbi:hypothetical protein ABW21_db0208747 [Orbilia brochopaga]|nr:hypothetical protein ABW21_db0208747 [Drechslerella brochopaga]
MPLIELVPVTDDKGQATIAADEDEDWKPQKRENGQQMIDDTRYPLIVFKKSESTETPEGLESLTLNDQTNASENKPTDPPDQEDEPAFKYPTPPRELLLNRWDPQTTWKPSMSKVKPGDAMKRCPEGLMRQLQEIQRHQVRRDLIHSWAASLKFLTGGPSNSSSNSVDAHPAQSYFKCSCKWQNRPSSAELDSCTCQSSARPFDPSSKSFSLVRLPRCSHYVAISYRWRKCPDDGIIITRDGEQKAASAPSNILLRAAAFSQHHGYQLLWCDQESIDQNDRADKEPGVQAMDIVYQDAAVCLTPLDVEIDTQDELDALALATKPGPFPDWEEWIEWVEEVPLDKLFAMAEVMQKIAADEWFGRSWTFQESTTAYATILLIKHAEGLTVTEHLGDLAGEVELPLCTFRLVVCKLQSTFTNYLRKAAWYAQQAEIQKSNYANRHHRGFGNSHHGHRRIREQAIAHQSQRLSSHNETYKRWAEVFGELVLHTLPQWIHGKRYSCFALEACQRLAKRKNSTVADRLVIISNLCQFDTRLNTNELASLGYDLAACILCLSILNGDLSIVRLEDGARYGSLRLNDWERLAIGLPMDESMIGLQTGPPLFSWAPRLVEGLTESRLARKPGFRSGQGQFTYHFSFRGPDHELHIDGWLWNYCRRIDVSGLAKQFYRRRFDDDAWARRKESSSELPPTRCNLQDCCAMRDPHTVRQCFWDLVQFFLENGSPELAESLWISLLISEWNHKQQGTENQQDPRQILELRQKIHTISFEEFSDQITLRTIKQDSNISPPQFWIIQRIIHQAHLDVWKLSNDSLNPSYAFFEASDDTRIFTPHRTPKRALSLLEFMDLQQHCLSWPVMATPTPHSSSRVIVSIHPTEGSLRPIRGFWNVDNVPPAPYMLH